MPTDGWALVLRTPWHRQRFLQHLVSRERESELGARSQDPCRATFEERAETLLRIDGARAVTQRGVLGIALTGLDLQAGLNDIAGGGEVGRGHACDGAGSEKLHDTELLARAFTEEVALQVVVGREVDG